MDYLIQKFDEGDKEISKISKREIEKKVKGRFRDLMNNYINKDILEIKTQVKMEFSPQTANGFERLNKKLEFDIDDGNILEAYEQFLDGWLDEELERIFGSALKDPGRITTLSDEEQKQLENSDADEKVEKLHGKGYKQRKEGRQKQFINPGEKKAKYSDQEENNVLRKRFEEISETIKKLKRS